MSQVLSQRIDSLAARAACFVAVLCAVGCTNSEPVTVGQQPTPLDDGISSCVPGENYEPEVDWEGYVENGQNPIAADRIRIREPRGDEPGFLLFGSGPLNPEPTDPDAGHPCPNAPVELYIAGHPYELRVARVTETRLRFRIWMQEPFDAWCALHSESSLNPGRADGVCELQGGVVSSGDPMNATCTDTSGNPVDCNAAWLCNYCVCDSAGCSAVYSDNPLFAAEDGSYAQFDIGVEGEFADGSVIGLLPDISASIGGITERVRFTKVQ